MHTHPWKLPGTVILRFTSAFMTRLTISYRDPDMFLVSRPSKRFSTSSLQTEEDEVTNIPAGSWQGLGLGGTHSFMLSVKEMSSSLEKRRIRKW